MRKITEQRNLRGEERDRFLITTTVEAGARIRQLSTEMGISYSKLIGDCVESKLSELEAKLEAT